MSKVKPFSGVDDRVSLADVIPLSTPFTLGISPSNACNFRCNYCVQSLDTEFLRDKYDFKRQVMSMDTFQEVVSQAACFPEKIKLLTFMGQGEPLLNPSLSKMISLAKKEAFAQRIDVVTNASLLTSERIIELIDSGLDVLRVSLQGLTSRKYKEVSGVDIDMEMFISNLAYFYEKGKGKCQLYVKILNASLEPGEDVTFYNLFDKISDRMFIEQIKPVYDGVDYSSYNYTLDTDRRGAEHSRRAVCPQPFFTLSVWPDGSVIPCSAIHKVCCLGNVHTGHLRNMWHSIMLKDFQTMQLKKKRHLHAQCGVCCAPDDCAHPEDDLDNAADTILNWSHYAEYIS